MARFRVACPGCDDVVVSAGDIAVVDHPAGASCYRYRCPVCGFDVEWACDDGTRRLFLLSGARATHCAGIPPGEVCCPCRRGPFSAHLVEDRVGEMRRLLDRPDWLDLLTEWGPNGP